jgi:Recombination endonuclease VII
LEHGKSSGSGYASGCRCSDCRSAHATRALEYYRANTRRILDRAAARRKDKSRRCVLCENRALYKSRYCQACKEVRRADRREKYRLQEQLRRLNPTYKERQRLKAAEYRRKNPERVREALRRYQAEKRPHLKMYGITKSDFDAMTRRQNLRCVICLRKCDLHVDHDHSSGRVRGLLCGNCNRGVGIFAESPQRLMRAARYMIHSHRLPFTAETT